MHHNQILGRQGETLAIEYLRERGIEVLDRNWRCSEGEIDIVAAFDDVLRFIEVKTRSSRAFGHPFEAVTPDKAARLHRLASRWRKEHQDQRQYQIDLIAVFTNAGTDVVIERLEDVR